jgi:hypothetical protein
MVASRTSVIISLDVAGVQQLVQKLGVSLGVWQRSFLPEGDSNERVVRSLFHRAVGYTLESEKAFNYQGQLICAPVIEHVPLEMSARSCDGSPTAGPKNGALVLAKTNPSPPRPELGDIMTVEKFHARERGQDG